MFEAFLASISLTPDQVSDLPVLTGTFTSPAVGYSIGLADALDDPRGRHQLGG